MTCRSWAAGGAAIAVALALGGGIVQAANVITVTASDGGTFSIIASGGDDQIVELNSPDTFTITADEDTTGTNNFDGYINTVRFGSGATDGTYNVRIAKSNTGNNYSTGARNVGWVDLASGNKRGNLGMVVIDGRWGYKKSGSSFTNCDPSSGEVTRLYEAKTIGQDNNKRFQVGTNTPDGGSGTITAGGEIIVGLADDGNSVGWTLAVTLARDLAGVIESTGENGLTFNSCSIGGSLSGAIRSTESIGGTGITIDDDLSGEIIANSDGDSTSSGVGNIDVPVLIEGSTTSTGLIEAKTRSGSGGQLLRKIEIDTDHGGAVTIGSSSALGSAAWVRINRFGERNSISGEWLSGATVRVAGTTYGRPTINAQNPYPQSYIDDRVYWVSAVKGDMQGDHLLNNFDIDPFTEALTDVTAYDANYPWLAESRVFHGDVGPVVSDVCTPNGQFNNFDIDCFTDLLTGG
ncbi:MAG: hypothetical protein IPM64_05435 [Phycisphaerales bacterium]|nr:hypothetical protein [Phycisphaerales bacterium]